MSALRAKGVSILDLLIKAIIYKVIKKSENKQNSIIKKSVDSSTILFSHKYMIFSIVNKLLPAAFFTAS